MEGKKQETTNDQRGKEEDQLRWSRSSFDRRGETRCQTAKEEFLGLKLRRRLTNGAHTPVPTWKTEAEADLMNGEVAGPSSEKVRRGSISVSASARQLGASLWEIQNLEMRNSTLSGRRGSGANRQRHEKELEEEASMDDRPKSSASLRNHMIKERRRRPPLLESPPSHSSSTGAAAINHAITPSCSSEINKPMHRDLRYGLKTSTELLKVLNRIWALEEQHTSNVSQVKSLKLELHQAHSRIREMEGLFRKVSDEKSVKKSKEKEKIRLLREEFEEERRVRKNSEHLQRKLGKDLNELKGAFLKSVKDLEKEKRVNLLLEDLCDEFAKGIRDSEEEIRVLKQGIINNDNNKDFGHKFDRVILHIAEAWLDERMQMQIAEKRGDLIEKSAIVERLSGEIKSSLYEKDKASCSKIEGNIISGNNGNFRRQSLESVHLNGTTSAPRVLEEDDEDSIASELHCFELQMGTNGSENYERYNNGKEKLDLNIEKTLPRKTCYEDSPKTNSFESVGNKFEKRNFARKNTGEISLLKSRGRFPENGNSGDLCEHNPEISRFTPELPPGVRDNTLKAKLIQARLEGRQARRLGGSSSGSARK